MSNASESQEDLVEQATLDFTLGEEEKALEALEAGLQDHPDSFAIHHALAEIYFSRRDLDEALTHGEKAASLDPNDIHIHTSLSRIWMERGNKEQAEEYGAKARMLGWKEQLKEPPPGGSSSENSLG